MGAFPPNLISVMGRTTERRAKEGGEGAVRNRARDKSRGRGETGAGSRAGVRGRFGSRLRVGARRDQKWNKGWGQGQRQG